MNFLPVSLIFILNYKGKKIERYDHDHAMHALHS